jgi:hypothetical protein
VLELGRRRSLWVELGDDSLVGVELIPTSSTCTLFTGLFACKLEIC